jgi:NADH dehydrogenase (ubiquinone) 1 alpha subcomplex subunit 5
MRSTLKLLATAGTASARHAERYLTPGNPTGLTGLLTHPCPRSALIYHYSLTLNKLAKLPPSSAYREATAALTKHRLAIVQGIEPAGYREWKEKAQSILQDNKEAFGTAVFEYGELAPDAFEARRFLREGFAREIGPEDRSLEWDGLQPEEPLEGIRTQKERDQVARRDAVRAQAQHFEGRGVEWEDSPPLEASQ